MKQNFIDVGDTHASCLLSTVNFSNTFFQRSACHSASCNFPRSRPQPCRPMCFSFSVVMVKSEPEVLANKGETCYHCRLRHHDHGHRQHQCGLLIPAENTMRAVLNNPCRETDAAEPFLGLSADTDTAGHDLPVEDAGVEPLQKDVRNKRDPVPRRAIGTQPRLRSSRHHSLFYLTSTTCRLLGKSICTLRQDGFQRICNGQLRLFHRIHNRSSLKGQRMFNRSSDLQCRAAAPA